MPSDANIRDVMGRKVRVHDTLADFFTVRDVLRDDLLGDDERFDVLLAVLYADPQGVCDALGDEILAFLSETLWCCFGVDIDGDREHDDKQILDWDEDRDRMIVTCRQAYQMGWDELRLTPYKEACLLMGMAPHETPMGQAIWYRTAKPPKRTKYNKDQIHEFEQAKKAYRLRGHTPDGQTKDSIEAANEAASARFAMIARMAANG